MTRDPDPAPAASDELSSFLRARDCPCPNCGYNLRGLAGARCPECNQLLELRIGLSEPRLGWYLASLCGLLAGVGMALVWLGIIAVLSIQRGFPGRTGVLLIYIILPAVTAVVLGTCAVLLSTRRARRWYRAGRRKIAPVFLACWGLTALAVGVFLSLVMR